jgi:ectoine hydroxylase-related dioxygenase (phytanoyl-CoA dioxygenase family)
MDQNKENQLAEWETEFLLGASQILAYQDDGVAKVENFFTPATLNAVRKEILAKVDQLGSSIDTEQGKEEYPSEDIDLYRKAFTQVFNLWKKSELIRSFISGRLAQVAAQLMEVPTVRVYHDQVLIKEPDGVATPWHLDHYYWPLATEKVLTAWIPLNPVTPEMGPLDFALGSHKLNFGRNEELVQQDEKLVENKLIELGCEIATSPYELGEVSFHQGWTFHRAGCNQTKNRRNVFTVIYMDQDMTLQEPTNSNQEFDREKWCPGVEVGQVINSEINPVLSLG